MIRQKRSLFFILLLSTSIGYAQNVAINADGSRANPNAILDIKSADKGLLIPRITTEARMRISNTQGLMVYDINTNSFWYNTGKKWVNMASPEAIAAKIADSAWALLGNAGTVDGTNFLGTTDNVPLNIRVNNQRSGRIDPVLFNTFFGYRSGFLITTGNDNTGLGSHALFHNTTGFNNTGVGSNALMSNSTGWHNTALGRLCLQANTTGFNNTAVGTSALIFNTTGRDNTGIGASTMFSSTTASQNTSLGSETLVQNIFGGGNTAIGYRALRLNTVSINTAIGNLALTANTTGEQNTATGVNALVSNTTGNGNTANGVNALNLNTTGTQNTAVGDRALFNNTTGNSNTAIGTAANVSAGGFANATAIGAGAIVNASNKVRIGNAAVTVIEGQVPFTFPSDGRFKFGVQEDVKGLDFIMQLRPVTYNFDTKRFDEQFADGKNIDPTMDAAYTAATSIRRTGFIAQEVEQAAKKTGYNFSGIIAPGKDQKHYSLSYDAFVVPLVKAMQEQQQVINDQQKTITEQQNKIATMEERLNKIEKSMKTGN